MIPWRFLDYVSPSGANLRQQWYDTQDDEVRAAFDFTVEQLRVTDDWFYPKDKKVKKKFKILDGKQAGLGELRFWTHGRTFRVPGIFRPTDREFVMFGGCEKQWGGAIHIPADAFETAQRNRLAYESGQGHTVDYI